MVETQELLKIPTFLQRAVSPNSRLRDTMSGGLDEEETGHSGEGRKDVGLRVKG